MLIDMSGEFLPELLLMKRLVRGAWKDERDADGGITSRFGFRLIVDGDGQLRVVDAGTGRRYVRPDEAEAEAAARRAEAAARQAEAAARMRAEQRVRELEAELAQLRPGPTPRRRNHR
jgi:acyl-CoA reductase-like NAD-dependent aldehyde dehydrogenase